MSKLLKVKNKTKTNCHQIKKLKNKSFIINKTYAEIKNQRF